MPDSQQLVPAENPLGTTTQVGAPVSTLSRKAQLVRKLNGGIQTTHGNIPIGLYRADLLPPESSLAESEPHPNELEVAYVELSFAEGFPTLPSGAPFWFKMDFEPAPAYSAFQLYLEQAETGPRSLHHIAADPSIQQLFNGHSHQLVSEWATIYYWRDRAKAHDIYREAAYRHIRAKRALYTEDRHYQVADKLLEIATNYISSGDFVEQMTPKTALEALKLAAGLQRISAGLPAAGPLTGKEEAAQASNSWELVVRQVAQRNDSGTFDQEGNLITDASLALNSLLDDPDHASVMQEVIIRMSAASKGNKSTPFPSRSRETPNQPAATAEDKGITDLEFIPKDE
jgi:hypothetical protein